MNNDKVNEALRACDALAGGRLEVVSPTHTLPVRWRDPEEMTSTGREAWRLKHVRWMIFEALAWPAERIEKKFRWLGFIQGAMWVLDVSSIDELKRMNMPPDADG